MLTTHRVLFSVGLLVGAALGLPAGAVVVVDASAAPLPACQYEDGNPDGSACMWTDPDTGAAYFVDSANYR